MKAIVPANATSSDQPTTGLDVTIQAQILELLRNLKQKSRTAFILIWHLRLRPFVVGMRSQLSGLMFFRGTEVWSSAAPTAEMCWPRVSAAELKFNRSRSQVCNGT